MQSRSRNERYNGTCTIHEGDDPRKIHGTLAGAIRAVADALEGEDDRSRPMYSPIDIRRYDGSVVATFTL